MAKASKRLPTVSTVAQAAEVFGGTKELAKAFRGLDVRGATAAPELFGLLDWHELPGYGRVRHE